jgi:hypothetical protein
VWQKFLKACVDGNSLNVLAEINTINAAKAHKPFQPDSEAHRKFRKKQVDLLQRLVVEYPFINWDGDLAFFADQ